MPLHENRVWLRGTYTESGQFVRASWHASKNQVRAQVQVPWLSVSNPHVEENYCMGTLALSRVLIRVNLARHWTHSLLDWVNQFTRGKFASKCDITFERYRIYSTQHMGTSPCPACISNNQTAETRYSNYTFTQKIEQWRIHIFSLLHLSYLIVTLPRRWLVFKHVCKYSSN